MTRSRLVFIVFFLTALLLLIVQLRISSARIFFSYRTEYVRQKRLMQQLWRKQIYLEKLINPDIILANEAEKENQQPQ